MTSVASRRVVPLPSVGEREGVMTNTSQTENSAFYSQQSADTASPAETDELSRPAARVIRPAKLKLTAAAAQVEVAVEASEEAVEAGRSGARSRSLRSTRKGRTPEDCTTQ
eukprot:GFUD01033299.1.p1 GENE.GFUD01033299.1~~GFUD01033299.1.p1  ORF type:complete len:111 (-),score=39.55 GFUD01033299.1:9-341(-)